MPRGKVKVTASTATMRAPGVEYSRNSQTLCTACQRRVQWNGSRWIHLVVYARGMHEARPDLGLVIESGDPWVAEKLALLETGPA
jgi:hypothetical protein